MRRPIHDRGWFATLALGAAALGAALLMVTVRLTSPTEGAVIRSEAWPWTRDGVAVEPTSVDSPFRRGDVVVALDGRPLATWVDRTIGLGPANPPLADPVAVDVVRDGHPLRLLVELRPFPAERVLGAPLGVAAFGALVLIVALALVLRRPRSTALRLLFVVAAANVADIVIWETGLEPIDVAGRPVVLALFAAGSIFNLVFWSAIVHLLAVYPVRSAWVQRRPAIVPAIYGVPLAGLIGLVAIARLAGGTSVDWVDRLAACHGFVSSVMLVLIIASTAAGYRRSPGWVRRSVRVVALALVAAALVTLLLLTLPITLTGATLVPRSVASAFALIVPIALVVAVARDRLFQVALLTRSRERIVAAREDERRRLRRDLHDGLGPSLAAVGLRLDAARDSLRTDPDGAEAEIVAARAGVRDVIAEIRRMSRELRPPALDSLGLVGALRQQAEALAASAEAGTRIEVETEATLPALPAAVEVAAYRIAVEAMMNVVRHASATVCRIRMSMGADELAIEVVDDGVGIGASGSGVGLGSMRERAAEVGGDVTIVDGDGGGTTVLARLPVDVSLLAVGRS
jgi:signal transduction histidine kinase